MIVASTFHEQQLGQGNESKTKLCIANLALSCAHYKHKFYFVKGYSILISS